MAKTGTFQSDVKDGYQITAKWTQIPNYDEGTFDLSVEFFLTTPGAYEGGDTLDDGGGPGTTADSRLYLYYTATRWGAGKTIYIDSFSWSLKVDAAGTYSLGTAVFEGITPASTGEINYTDPNWHFVVRYGEGFGEYYSLTVHDYDSSNQKLEDLLDRVVKASTAIFPTTYLGDTATIVVSRSDSSFRHKLRYEIGGLSGDISDIITALSFDWQVPFSFLPLFGDTEIEKKGILYCDTYVKGSDSNYYIAGTTQSDFTVLLDGNTNGPQFNATIKDTNSVTLALTGNENALVRFYSNAYVETGAVAQGQATVVSQSVVCGNQSLLAGQGTITGVESSDFVMSATDSRGLTAIQTVKVTPFIEYSKLTCNVFTSPVETDGDLTFKVNGNYFNGSFGAVNNSLEVLYRYKVKDGTYSDWLTATVTPSDSNYEVSITLTGMDYTQMYVIQAKATDKLETITSAEMAAVGSPIFDWSKEDFNFNVPVTAQEGIIYPADKAIYGVDSNGNQIPALTPKTSTGDLYLGYGNYQQESGSTKIYGNGIDLISNGDITLNGASINDMGLAKIGTWQPVCNACTLPTYSLGNYFRINDICVINFFFQGPATSEPLYIEFTGLPFTPDTGYRWQAGGGCASGYKVAAAEHVFSGWSIEQGKIYGKTTYAGSSAGSVAVGSYITASQGVTFYASGTIMYKIAEG